MLQIAVQDCLVTSWKPGELKAFNAAVMGLLVHSTVVADPVTSIGEW